MNEIPFNGMKKYGNTTNDEGKFQLYMFINDTLLLNNLLISFLLLSSVILDIRLLYNSKHFI